MERGPIARSGPVLSVWHQIGRSVRQNPAFSRARHPGYGSWGRARTGTWFRTNWQALRIRLFFLAASTRSRWVRYVETKLIKASRHGLSFSAPCASCSPRTTTTSTRHPSFVIRHPSFVICHFSIPIPRSAFRNSCQNAERVRGVISRTHLSGQSALRSRCHDAMP